MRKNPIVIIAFMLFSILAYSIKTEAGAGILVANTEASNGPENPVLNQTSEPKELIVQEADSDVQLPDPVTNPSIDSRLTSSRSSPFDAPTRQPVITVTLSFAGDCTLGDDDKYTWNTFDQVYDEVGDDSYFFKEVLSVFSADDYTFINFEGTFTQSSEKAEKEYRFKGDPSYVEILKAGSIEGVTLANNHSLDYLEKGFNDTVDTLTLAGVDYTYFDTYFIKNINGMKIGFLGYKGWQNETRSNALLKKQVQEMREQGVVYIVASYHWGDQYSYAPNFQQIQMAHYAIDNGVDLVVGHHPHVLQGMEMYNGKPIVYSLGNFCFGGSPVPKDYDTIIYQNILTYDVQTQMLLTSESNIIPAKVSSVKGKNNYQPIIAKDKEADRILEKFESLSKSLAKKSKSK